MCGLVGVAGDNLEVKDTNAFYYLLHFDTLRGTDSTGVATVRKDKDQYRYGLFKEIGIPYDLYYKYKNVFWKNTLTSYDLRVALGHNRAATQGQIDVESAHPFEFENLIGAHNGTVSQWSLCDFHGYKDFNIDSQIIFSHLSHTRDLQDVWSTADGAMALSWWDKVDKTLNLVRNEQRSLFYGYSKDHKKLYWASESWMIYIATQKAGIEIDKIYDVTPNKHYIFTLNEDKVDLRRVELKPFEKKFYPVVVTKGGYNTGGGVNNVNRFLPNHSPRIQFTIEEFHAVDGNTGHGYFVGKTAANHPIVLYIPLFESQAIRDYIKSKGKDTQWISTKVDWNGDLKGFKTLWEDVKLKSVVDDEEAKSEKSFLDEKEKEKVKGKILYPIGFQGELLTQEEFETMLKEGCITCTGYLGSWSDRGNIAFLGRNEPICHLCAHNYAN